jgi:hypothetical protein
MARDDRLRLASQRELLDLLEPPSLLPVRRELVQVYNGGAMPTTVPAVYLTHPAMMNGAETEAAAPTFDVDATTTIPVVVLGPRVPVAGDYLVAHGLGGRMVAQGTKPSGPPTLSCSPCNIPKKNLALCWANGLSGNGSTTLVFTEPGGWNSSCTNQLLYNLTCNGGLIQFTVTYFLSGTCPTGQSQQCLSPGSNPYALNMDAYTCAPLYLHYTVTGSNCPVLFSNGYSAFWVKDGNCP